MTGKTHVICGITTMAAIAVCNLDGINIVGYRLLPLVSLFTAPAGSLMPDIDLHTSTLGKKHPKIAKAIKHRGITHTLLVPLIMIFLQWWLMGIHIPFLPELIFGFNIGYIIHIVADMFNKKGVPILWPAVPSNFHVATVLTGSKEEYVFITCWVLVHAFLSYLILL